MGGRGERPGSFSSEGRVGGQAPPPGFLWGSGTSCCRGWLSVFWKASCCSCSISLLACCRSASRSSAVCLLGEGDEETQRGDKGRRGDTGLIEETSRLLLWQNSLE